MTENTPTAAMTPRELWKQENDAANERLQQLARSVTQREWLLITAALDRTRNEIGADTGLTLLAMGWVREKRDHGGASWDRLLDFTDEQLQQLHGYPDGDEDDQSDQLPSRETPAPVAPVPPVE